MPRKYLRAAQQRYTSAEWLLRNHLCLDATYLAGYVVECAIKALILSRTPKGQRSRIAESISRGAGGHDLERLKEILRVRRCQMPLDVARMFRRVATWSVDLRYEVGLVEYSEAEAFLSAAKAVLDWCTRSI